MAPTRAPSRVRPAQVNILSTLTQNERLTMADALEPQQYADGEVIIEQGTSGDAFYIIAEGEVDAAAALPRIHRPWLRACSAAAHSRDAPLLWQVSCTQRPGPDKPATEIGRCVRGGYFGEIALLTNRSRACTVTAVGRVTVLALQRSTFTRVMGPLRNLLKRNMQAYNSFMLM